MYGPELALIFSQKRSVQPQGWTLFSTLPILCSRYPPFLEHLACERLMCRGLRESQQLEKSRHGPLLVWGQGCQARRLSIGRAQAVEERVTDICELPEVANGVINQVRQVVALRRWVEKCEPARIAFQVGVCHLVESRVEWGWILVAIECVAPSQGNPRRGRNILRKRSICHCDKGCWIHCFITLIVRDHRPCSSWRRSEHGNGDILNCCEQPPGSRFEKIRMSIFLVPASDYLPSIAFCFGETVRH